MSVCHTCGTTISKAEVEYPGKDYSQSRDGKPVVGCHQCTVNGNFDKFQYPVFSKKVTVTKDKDMNKVRSMDGIQCVYFERQFENTKDFQVFGTKAAVEKALHVLKS